MAGAPALPFLAHREGLLLIVRVMPRAGRTAVAGLRDGALLVRLAAAPVAGAANAALVDVLSRALDLPRRQVSIHSGSTSRDKRVLLRGIAAATLAARLTQIVNPR